MPGSAGPGSSRCARLGPSRPLLPGGPPPQTAWAATPPAGNQRSKWRSEHVPGPAFLRFRGRRSTSLGEPSCELPTQGPMGSCASGRWQVATKCQHRRCCLPRERTSGKELGWTQSLKDPVTVHLRNPPPKCRPPQHRGGPSDHDSLCPRTPKVSRARWALAPGIWGPPP